MGKSRIPEEKKIEIKKANKTAWKLPTCNKIRGLWKLTHNILREGKYRVNKPRPRLRVIENLQTMRFQGQDEKTLVLFFVLIFLLQFPVFIQFCRCLPYCQKRRFTNNSEIHQNYEGLFSRLLFFPVYTGGTCTLTMVYFLVVANSEKLPRHGLRFNQFESTSRFLSCAGHEWFWPPQISLFSITGGDIPIFFFPLGRG